MEAVRVVVRCRPFSKRELEGGYKQVAQIDRSAKSVSVRRPDGVQSGEQEVQKTFTFDSVFDETCTQRQVYDETAKRIVDSVLDGFNGTVFAYGQTGTGKSFSMQGIMDDPELRGIIPNAFHHIFDHIAQTANRRFLVSVQYLEIYNEEIRDLLSTEKGGKRGLELKEHPDRGVYVKDLSNHVVKSVAEMDKLMTLGYNNRSVGATLMNAESSRSHSIFTINVESIGQALDGSGGEHIIAGKLNLVDLAGSERQAKTGAAGDRLKEAAKINLSLTALGNCISALVDGKAQHIPFRDSKLTRLLQNSLGGNAKTLMIATMSPADYNYDETMSTLRYANRAKNIKNKPKVNEDPKDTMLREFQEEIQRLREMLMKRNGGAGTASDVNGPVNNGKKAKRTKAKKAKARRATNNGADDAEEEDDVDIELDNNADDGNAAAMAAEDEAELQHIAQVQAEIDAERQRLQQSTTMAEEEKAQLHEALNVREQELERERLEREDLSMLLTQMESKLLVGGVSIHDHVHSQQEQMAEQQRLIADKERRASELKKRLAEKQGAQVQLEETYASLQEEVDVKSKKLRKLYAKLQAVRGEREELLETVRELSREIKLKDEIAEHFIPRREYEEIKQRVVYDEVEEVWRLRSVIDYHQAQRLERPVATPEVFGKQAVSLVARWKMATMAPEPRYRPRNILTVKMDMPERETALLPVSTTNQEAVRVLDPNYQHIFTSIQQNIENPPRDRPASRATPRSSLGGRLSAVGGGDGGAAGQSFPTARNLMAEKKRYA